MKELLGDKLNYLLNESNTNIIHYIIAVCWLRFQLQGIGK
jgi:hypothetical protein